MNYYLAYICSYGKEDGYYELVKAATKEKATQKVKNLVGKKKFVEVSDTIE